MGCEMFLTPSSPLQTLQVKISDAYLLKWIGGGMAALTLYMIIATALDPLMREPVISPNAVIDEFGTKHFVQISECGWVEGSSLYYPVLFVVLTSLVAVCAMATQSRKIPSAFAESKWIALSMYNLTACLCFVGFLISDGRLKFDNPGFYHAGVAMPVTLASFVFMNLMFMPKFRKILYGKKLELTDMKVKESSSGDLSKGGGLEMGKMSGSPSTSSTWRRGSSRWSLGSFNVGGSSGAMANSPRGGTRNPLADGSINGSVISDESSFVENEVEQRERVKSEGRQKLESDVVRLAKEKELLVKKGKKAIDNYTLLESQYKKLEKHYQDQKTKIKEDALEARVEEMTKIPEGSSWNLFYDEAGNEYYYNSDNEECSYSKPARWF